MKSATENVSEPCISKVNKWHSRDGYFDIESTTTKTILYKLERLIECDNGCLWFYIMN